MTRQDETTRENTILQKNEMTRKDEILEKRGR